MVWNLLFDDSSILSICWLSLVIIIIIIKRGRQCKAESPKTPAPQYQHFDRMKRKGKIVEDHSRDRADYRPIKQHWPSSWNPPVPYHRTRGQQDRSRETQRETKVLWYCEVLQRSNRQCISRPQHATSLLKVSHLGSTAEICTYLSCSDQCCQRLVFKPRSCFFEPAPWFTALLHKNSVKSFFWGRFIQ